MGIVNIHLLISPEVIMNNTINPVTQAQAAHLQALIYAHRRGEHPYGSMRRDCPLCQPNK